MTYNVFSGTLNPTQSIKVNTLQGWRWRRGVVASVVRRMNEVTLRRARLVLGWVFIGQMTQPTVSKH